MRDGCGVPGDLRGKPPDHVTFARFRGDFPEAVAGFFTEVLVLCARLGMGQLGTVALDGMKIAASASKSANRTEEGLRKLAAGAVAAHAAADAAEDELFGAGRRGDEVPEEAWSPQRRGERIRRALADLEAERKAAEQGGEGGGVPEAAADRAADRVLAGLGGGGTGGGEPGPGPGSAGGPAGGTGAAVRGRAAPRRPRGPRGAGGEATAGSGRPGPGSRRRGGGPPGRNARPRSGRHPVRAPARCGTSPTRTRG